MIKERLKALAAWLDELLFPSDILCLCCGRALGEDARDGICPACLDALARLSGAQDARERPIAPPPGIGMVHAAFSYEGPARQLIHRLKYDGIRAAHIPLARYMALLPSGEEEIIVPVPTDRRRLRRRGYNQAALLAKHIGDTLGMEVCEALYRKEERRAQTGLSAEQRLLNVVGCMEAKPTVSGKRVLLIDDVYTTGATAREAARALLKAGAAGVSMFAAAASLQEEGKEKDPFALPNERMNRTKSLKKTDKIRMKL